MLGIKPWHQGDPPVPVRTLINALPAEAERFPDPFNLGVPENIMLWARTPEGQRHAAATTLFDAAIPFDKRGRHPPPHRDELSRLSRS